MKKTNYNRLLQEKLISNLESKSVIVVDNASYHKVQLNRHPTSNARKVEMLFWLDKHGVWYSSYIKMHKPLYMRLLQLIVCSPSMDTQLSEYLSIILI
jgi:predicted O-methyltransferase YrrM